MHECMLCGKDMKKSKYNFGSGCIKSIYKLLDIKIPQKVCDREKYLYKYIMKETGEKNLNKDQKIWLLDRYLTGKYIDNIRYCNCSEVKSELEKEILTIGKTKRNSELKTIKVVTLKDSYSMYRKEQKFNRYIEKINEEGNNEKKDIKEILKLAPMGLILKKDTKILEKGSIIGMQYALWTSVVLGGKIFKYDSSAEFLEHSLKKNPVDLVITEGDIVEEIRNDIQFVEKLKIIVKKYGKGTDKFITSAEDNKINFDNKDLYYAIHSSNMVVEGCRKGEKWNLHITLDDVYDYTDFKQIEDYYRDTNSVPKSVFSSFIYNLAYFSVKFKVINEYKIKIEFDIDDYEEVG